MSAFQEILSRVDPVAIISEYVPLRRSGKNFVGKCPFHGDKDPSLSVSAEGLFYCFGCGKRGNLIGFLMEVEHLDRAQAWRRLAEKAGMPPPVLRLEGKNRPLYEACEWAAAFFRRRLTSSGPDGGKARRYLDSRKLPAALAERAGIGYAPPDGKALLAEAAQAGVSENVLLSAGLATRTVGGLRDAFLDRLMFPIRTFGGMVCGFAGRALSDAAGPKYINSAETAIFSKSRILYGLDVARGPIRHANRAIVVEGYLDCLFAWQAGFGETCATMGTALTEAHGDRLRAMTETVVLLFDADAAGRAASLRSALLLQRKGLAVWIAALPAGKDLDELVLDRGPAGVREVLDRMELPAALLARELALREELHANSNLAKKLAAVKEILPYLLTLEDRILRSEAMGRVAEILRLERSALEEELRRRTSAPPAPLRPASSAARPSGKEARLVELVLASPEAAEAVRAEVSPDRFEDPVLGRIFQAALSGALAELDEAAAAVAAQLRFGVAVPEDRIAEAAREAAHAIRRQAWLRRSRELRLECGRLLRKPHSEWTQEEKARYEEWQTLERRLKGGAAPPEEPLKVA